MGRRPRRIAFLAGAGVAVKILCTLPMHAAGLRLLEDVAEVAVVPDSSADTLIGAIGDVDYLVVRTMLPQNLFDYPQRLKGVVRHGTGLDLIPMESATAKAIPVANVPGANAQAVVEYCIGSMLSWARRLDLMASTLRSKGWSEARQHSVRASELWGKTVGIVGVGTIGASLARLCKEGFGMRVLGHQRRLDRLPPFVEGMDLDALLAESDYVVLTCPLTHATHGLISQRRLQRMRPHAVLINAARGAVVDETALAAVLRERRIRGASLDVFETQPLPASHPFWMLENVALTPHVGGLTEESNATMSIGTARQILQLIAGEMPTHLVNPEVWDRAMARRAEETLHERQ